MLRAALFFRAALLLIGSLNDHETALETIVVQGRGGGGLAQPQPAVAGDGAARPTSELKSATAASPGILLLCIRMSSASASSIPSGGRQMHVPRRSRTRGNLRAVRRQAAAACHEWHSRGTGWHPKRAAPGTPAGAVRRRRRIACLPCAARNRRDGRDGSGPPRLLRTRRTGRRRGDTGERRASPAR